MLPDAAPQGPPSDGSLSAVGPSEVPAEVDPQQELNQAFSGDPREPVLNACADAVLWCASLVTAESRPDEVKAYGAAAESFARAMAALNPPMKPIDPNLHASQRGVDPQAVFDTAAAADTQAAQQQHDLQKQAADHAHQAGLKAIDAAARADQPAAQPQQQGQPQRGGGKPAKP